MGYKILYYKNITLVEVPESANCFHKTNTDSQTIISYDCAEGTEEISLPKNQYTILDIAHNLDKDMYPGLVEELDFKSSQVPLYRNYMYMKNSEPINKCVGFANAKRSFESKLTLDKFSPYTTLVLMNKRLYTIRDGEIVEFFLKRTIDDTAKLIGSLGKGNTSLHDIDISLPNIVRTEQTIKQIKWLLDAESFQKTDWGGVYYTNTFFGDVDVFFKGCTDKFTY